jgi:glucose-6-phosphate dehydrogenase assembly protein OpcA
VETAVTRAQPAIGDEQAVHQHLMRFGEEESLATPLWEERDTSIRAVAGHLASLWSGPMLEDGRDAALVTEKGLSHARASVLNLVVTAVDAGAADRVVRTLTGLGVRHPSRAIILVPDPGARGPTLDARVSAHCQDTQGGPGRVCYEEVVLTIRGEGATHLNGIVAPLLIHDLPTHVWWPGNPPFRDPVFDQLIGLADRLIVDSADFGDIQAGMRRLATLRHRSGVGDLSWERLAWWQELTAQFFDAPRFRRYLPNLNRLAIRFAVGPTDAPHPDETADVAPGTSAPSVQALLYAAWLATRLDWRRHATISPLAGGACRLRLEGKHEMVDLELEPVETEEIRPGDLLSVRLRAYGETGAAEFIIDRDHDSATVATNADGMTALLRRVPMGSPAEHELLSAQLASDVVDPVYEQSLRAATVLLAAACETGAAA